MAAPNFILLGDLNLDLDNPEADGAAIDTFIRGMNKEAFNSNTIRRIYFPFIDKHPKHWLAKVLSSKQVPTASRKPSTG